MIQTYKGMKSVFFAHFQSTNFPWFTGIPGLPFAYVVVLIAIPCHYRPLKGFRAAQELLTICPTKYLIFLPYFLHIVFFYKYFILLNRKINFIPRTCWLIVTGINCTIPTPIRQLCHVAPSVGANDISDHIDRPRSFVLSRLHQLRSFQLCFPIRPKIEKTFFPDRPTDRLTSSSSHSRCDITRRRRAFRPPLDFLQLQYPSKGSEKGLWEGI